MFVLALALVALQTASVPELSVFERLDVFELEFAADPQISPDGSQVAYVRQSFDIMIDRTQSDVWLVSIDGENHRPLIQRAHSARWSPSGDRIAYLSAVEGRGVELHMRWMDTGQMALLTNLPESPGSLTWAPDGKSLAFSMFVESKDDALVTPPAMPEGAEWAPAPRVIESMNYRADGGGYLETGNTHIFQIAADGGTPRQLTSGDFDHSGPMTFAPNGTRVVFSANRLEDYEHQPVESELWSLAFASGAMTQLTHRIGPDHAPTFSPDGTKIAYLGFDDRKLGYQNEGLYIMDVASGGVIHAIPELDRSVGAIRWVADSERLLVQYDEGGERVLAVLAISGDLNVLVSNVGGATLGRPYTSGGFTVADDDTIAYSAGSAFRPADVGVVHANGSTARLTALNEDLLGQKTLGNVEEMHWRSSIDALSVEGWLVTPPDFDASQKYPLILEIHGGPFAAYGPHFSAEMQLYAAAGYVVLYMNPRGSTSYGHDFANKIHHNYPSQDYDDLMSGVDAVIARGFVDPDKLFVTGGSGGGVLTAWIVGKTGRFRAAVSAKPVINWISTVLTTDISAFMPGYWFASLPWEDPDAYWDRSPLSLVGNVTTPTMLLTGEEDHRTPIPESEQFYQALKLRKVDTALVRIPEASHGITRRPSHLIAKVDHILAWFERYLGE